MNTNTNTAVAPASGRGTVTRISDVRRSERTRPDVLRAREARRQIRSRTDAASQAPERFAHLKRMYD